MSSNERLSSPYHPEEPVVNDTTLVVPGVGANAALSPADEHWTEERTDFSTDALPSSSQNIPAKRMRAKSTSQAATGENTKPRVYHHDRAGIQATQARLKHSESFATDVRYICTVQGCAANEARHDEMSRHWNDGKKNQNLRLIDHDMDIYGGKPYFEIRKLDYSIATDLAITEDATTAQEWYDAFRERYPDAQLDPNYVLKPNGLKPVSRRARHGKKRGVVEDHEPTASASIDQGAGQDEDSTEEGPSPEDNHDSDDDTGKVDKGKGKGVLPGWYNNGE
ncbi:hypothetical protein LTR84_012043 [Exophiala bonariae]|uniref:Uncharacterized protein n=1 Tax=Exophiala bonariae TaxID=1690606 RepID=A0AAV9NGB3_9EURO|nr:hypothetical protein LTR84_012043 [Exophiala bonariae]